MVRLSLDDPQKDMFWYYGLPSVLVHGKSHGIQDVLRRDSDETTTRSRDSLWLERVLEMNRATGFALRYGFCSGLTLTWICAVFAQPSRCSTTSWLPTGCSRKRSR